VKKSCVTVTGVIVSRKLEPDGDLHIRLSLDSQFEGMLNDGKKTNQGGNLVVEPICDHTVTQSDAVSKDGAEVVLERVQEHSEVILLDIPRL